MNAAAYKIIDAESILYCSSKEVAVLNDQAVPPLEGKADTYLLLLLCYSVRGMYGPSTYLNNIY